MSEILSPVGNKEMLVAAVRAGADAVYMGFNNFNARRGAENFTEEQFCDAVKYCRERGVKCYLTLNTELYENELKSAVDAAVFAAECGINGIICADLGLAALLKKAIPQMPLHASTQLSVHSASALPQLKELGFCRVVPAREMSKRELVTLCKKAKELQTEVEVFVHGALCMCLSGQCLISAFLGGRSGNRGLCAGTCRLPFSAGGENGYALSLKDMSLIDYLPELSEMGVDSFKIEGRKKPPEYVAAATAAALSMLEQGFVEEELKSKLIGIFSRSGFTDGYYTGKTGSDMFGFRTDEQIAVSKKTKSELHELYRRERQSVGIDISVVCEKEKPLSVTMADSKNTVTVTGDIPQKAENKPLEKQQAEAAFSKLGGTPFFAKSISVSLSDGVFVPSSGINSLRREAAEKLLLQRSKPVKPEVCDYSLSSPRQFSGDTKLVLSFRDVAEMPKDLHAAAAVILPAEQLSKYSGSAEVFARLPRNADNAELLKNGIEAAKKSGCTVIAENIGELELIKSAGLKFICGSGFNVFNFETKKELEKSGACGVWLSHECRKADAVKMGEKAFLTVYGKVPLMLTKNCPVKAQLGCKACSHKITDRKGIDFPVFCRGGYSEIYNSRPIWLADRLHEFRGIEYGVLMFCDETKEQAEEIIKKYINGEKPTVDYTRGLYEKGVL